MIHKYEIKFGGATLLPHSANLVHVGTDPRGKICVWAEVHPDLESTTEYIFTMVGTGQFLDEGIGVYIATLHDDPYVWHIYWGFGKGG